MIQVFSFLRKSRFLTNKTRKLGRDLCANWTSRHHLLFSRNHFHGDVANHEALNNKALERPTIALITFWSCENEKKAPDSVNFFNLALSSSPFFEPSKGETCCMCGSRERTLVRKTCGNFEVLRTGGIILNIEAWENRRKVEQKPLEVVIPTSLLFSLQRSVLKIWIEKSFNLFLFLYLYLWSNLFFFQEPK